MLSKKDIIYLNSLIKSWNTGEKSTQHEVITLLQPLIKNFSESEYLNNKRVMTTTIILFFPEDIAQTVSLKLIERQKNIYIESVNDFYILLRKMVYGVIIDEVRKLTSSRHGLGDRILVKNCKTYLFAEDNCLDDSEVFFEFSRLLDNLEEKSRDQALAFSFYHLWGYDIVTIQLILNISERTVWRYIEYAHKRLISKIKEVELNV